MGNEIKKKWFKLKELLTAETVRGLQRQEAPAVCLLAYLGLKFHMSQKADENLFIPKKGYSHDYSTKNKHKYKVRCSSPE